MKDHTIPKTTTMGVYSSHQLVEQLTDGQRPLFADLGDRLVIRSDDDLTNDGKPLRDASDGDLLAFELIASCGTKSKGKHNYFPKGDWRSRKSWLERRAEASGFEVCAVSITARSEVIEKKGRRINIDRSDFAGILKVTNAEAFRRTLADGISTPAKAFGRGMIRV